MSSNKNRYDFMKAGEGIDPVTGANYPDPISINYNDIKINKKPVIVSMDESDIFTYLALVDKVYGDIDYDDLILTLNGYSHRNFIEIGDTLYFPDIEDIENSFSKKKN